MRYRYGPDEYLERTKRCRAPVMECPPACRHARSMEATGWTDRCGAAMRPGNALALRKQSSPKELSGRGGSYCLEPSLEHGQTSISGPALPRPGIRAQPARAESFVRTLRKRVDGLRGANAGFAVAD